MYKYVSSADFVSLLEYDHIETYSFQRGDEYMRHQQYSIEEYNRLDRVIQKAIKADGEIKQEYVSRFEQLKKQVGKTQFLINEYDKLNFSAQLTHTFNEDDAIVQKIDTILRTPAKDVPAWMCAPIFRDGIVYYDKSHSIIACLNICFSCEYMMLNEYTYINADASVYAMLKNLFISLGHEIDSDNNSTFVRSL